MRYGEILDLENDTALLNWSSILRGHLKTARQLQEKTIETIELYFRFCQGSTVASCRLEGQRNVAECNVSGLARSLMILN